MDKDAILPAVNKANQQKIPVIAYDRLFEAPGITYITFDNKEVGRMTGARGILAVKPKGNYAIIKGDADRQQCQFPARRPGRGAGCDAIKKGDIKIVGEEYTDRLETRECPEEHGTDPDQERQQGRRRGGPERRHGRRRDCGTDGQGPQGHPGVRPGRRPCGAEPCGAGHPDRVGLEKLGATSVANRRSQAVELGAGKKVPVPPSGVAATRRSR
jgi:hypothetical protein